MAEKVIICVSNPLHAEHLIASGAKLVQSLQPDASGCVLNLHSAPYDEMDFDDLHARQMFRVLSAKYGLPVVERLCRPGRVPRTIADFVREQGATRLVIGQSPHTRLSGLFRRPLQQQIEKLCKQVKLHPVEVDATRWNSESVFQHGTRKWLVKSPDGQLLMVDDAVSEAITSGIFFHRADTDFEHGYFVPWPADQVHAYEITDCALSQADGERLLKRLKH